VREIVSVPGRVESDVIEVEPVFRRDGARLVLAGGVPPRPERFAAVGADLDRLLGRSSQWPAAMREA
jgi:pilus assembly protein CpaF